MMGGSHRFSRDAGLKFSGSARFNKLKRKGSEVLDYECRDAGHLDGLKPYILGGIIKDVGKWCFKPPRFPFFRGTCFRSPFRTAPAFELAIVITIPLVNKKKTSYIDPFYGKRNSDHKHIVRVIKLPLLQPNSCNTESGTRMSLHIIEKLRALYAH